jgi:hypothetical protein
LLTEYEIIYLIFAINSGAFCGFLKIGARKSNYKRALDLQLDYRVAKVKMECGYFTFRRKKFNQALIYYSQIEMDLKK